MCAVIVFLFLELLTEVTVGQEWDRLVERCLCDINVGLNYFFVIICASGRQ